MSDASSLDTDRSILEIGDELAAIADPADRRRARLRLREQMLQAKHSARKRQNVSKLADAIARFGGGSLLTATVVLLINGDAGPPVRFAAVLTLLLFVVGTILWMYYDRRSVADEARSDWLEAVLKETER